jgi:hypothetical protein
MQHLHGQHRGDRQGDAGHDAVGRAYPADAGLVPVRWDKAQLIVRLPANQRAAFLAGVKKSYRSVMKTLADVDAEKAQACYPKDRENIVGAVARQCRLRHAQPRGQRPSARVVPGDGGGAGKSRGTRWLSTTSMNDFGKHDEALSFFRRSLDIKLATLGDKHPSTAATYNNMAIVFKSQAASTRPWSTTTRISTSRWPRWATSTPPRP